MITNNGAFLGTTGNLPQFTPNEPLISHHLTMTGDPAGSLMKVHDTFQVGSQSMNISGSHYNNLGPSGPAFNPSPAASTAFRNILG